MSTHVRSIVLCIAALATACSGSQSNQANNPQPTATPTAEASAMPSAAPSAEPPPPPPPPAPAHVRVIHASPASAAATVAISVDNATPPAIPSLGYKASWGYENVPPGAHHVAIRPAAAAADSAPAVEGDTPALESDHYYTVIAHGLVGGTPALAITAAADDATAPDAGNARIRFYHALAGVAAADICVAGANARAAGTPVFTNVAYGTWGTPAGEGAAAPYARVAPGAAIRLQVRAQNARPCTGAVAGVINVPATAIADRGVYTAIAVGNTARTGGAAKELLVLSDAPATTGRSEPTALPIAAR